MRFIYRVKQFILILSDLFGYTIGLWIALLLRRLTIPSGEYFSIHFRIFFIIFIFWIIINYINGLYDLVRVKNTKESYRRLLEAGLLSLLVGVIFFYLIPVQTISGNKIQVGQLSPKTILLLNALLGYSIACLFRYFYNILIGEKKLKTNVLFIGCTPEVTELIQILKQQAGKGYRAKAIVDGTNCEKDESLKDVDIYQNLKTIRPAITNHDIGLVVISPHLKQNSEVLTELYELLFWPVQMVDLASFYELITGRIPPSTFSESWFLDHLRNQEQPLYNKLREIMDIVSGIILGLFFIVLFVPIALAIKISSTGPIFFIQKRVGKFGKPFKIYKFRSMFALSADGSAEVNGAEFAKKKDVRKTSVGKILRMLRLDELPQFLNLLKRDITLIGPRPERPEIVETLTERMPYYPLRHIIRPGLTGWAVLHQNYSDTLETTLQKLQYDLYYIKNRSIILDISIILKTVNVVIRLKGQ
ncbi:exopolysaccharide biosynthesis polyprenyl glycosylphosphotransferase [Patescibacteria group bacterium]|nr:exopolysaccharide biosynthesis polyprenyl glycosylphosphotransferase [Patescibacteria group bacterium]MBU1895486.1 exopolysaccharide biosynthesis polyprenyl glycosylphosphotransferase [Patescibacteria group bacterium]